MSARSGARAAGGAAPGPRLEGVLFDKDGTLFDFHGTWAGWAARMIDELSLGDARLGGALARAWGFDRARSRFCPDSVVVAGDLGEVAAAVAPLLPGYSQGRLRRRLDEAGARVEGVAVVPLGPCLGGLARRGLRLGLATNDSEAAARAQLGRHGVLAQFDFIAGFDSGHGAKPEAGMCRAFAAACALAPERVVMVGDSRHDMAAGRAAGMRTVAVLSGPAGRDELAPLADAVLPHIGHLPGWLDAAG